MEGVRAHDKRACRKLDPHLPRRELTAQRALLYQQARKVLLCLQLPKLGAGAVALPGLCIGLAALGVYRRAWRVKRVGQLRPVWEQARALDLNLLRSQRAEEGSTVLIREKLGAKCAERAPCNDRSSRPDGTGRGTNGAGCAQIRSVFSRDRSEGFRDVAGRIIFEVKSRNEASTQGVCAKMVSRSVS